MSGIVRFDIRLSTGLRATVSSCAMLVVVAVALSCGGGSDITTAPPHPPARVATIALSGGPPDGLLLSGQLVNLVAAARDSAGNALLGRVMSWASSNVAVASVSTSGVVTPAATGPVTISVTSEGQVASADFAVRVAIGSPLAGATQDMTTTILNGAITITVPPGAVPGGMVLNAAPADGATVPASSQLLRNTGFVFGPDGTQFSKPVTLSLLVDTTNLAPLDRAGLALYLAKNGSWEEIPGSTVSGNHVSALISHFSTYGVLRRPAPASIVERVGDGQTSLVSSAVPIAPSVTVLDARGQGVAFVAVQFSVSGGGGSVTGAAQVTDANGVATVGSWTLGPVSGSNSLSVSAGTLTPFVFRANGTEPTLSALWAVSGFYQTSLVGMPVPLRPSVQARNSTGRGVPNVTVRFTVVAGGGSVTDGVQVTGTDGMATVGGWTLGPAEGANSLTATVGTLPPVIFPATGTAPRRMILIAGDGVSAAVGTRVGVLPTLQVQGSDGYPLSRVVVTFAVGAGGGTVNGATQVTGSDGIAVPSGWTLGTVAGTNTVTATVSGLAPVTFTATATAPAPPGVFPVAGSYTLETSNGLALPARLNPDYLVYRGEATLWPSGYVEFYVGGSNGGAPVNAFIFHGHWTEANGSIGFNGPLAPFDALTGALQPGSRFTVTVNDHFRTRQTLVYRRIGEAPAPPVRPFDGGPRPVYSSALSTVGTGPAMTVTASWTAMNPDVITRTLPHLTTCPALMVLTADSTNVFGRGWSDLYNESCLPRESIDTIAPGGQKTYSTTRPATAFTADGGGRLPAGRYYVFVFTDVDPGQAPPRSRIGLGWIDLAWPRP